MICIGSLPLGNELVFNSFRQVNQFVICCRTPALDVATSGPTTAQATMYPSTGVKGPYTLTATPVGGGSAVTVTCATPDCTLTGLKPGTDYTCSVTGIDTSSGKPTPPSPAVTITTPAAGAPALNAEVTGPGSISVDVSPTSSGVTGPYTLTATPIGGGTPIIVTCAVPYDCVLTGLAPGTTYDVTATATAAGQPTPASAPTTITTPAAK